MVSATVQSALIAAIISYPAFGDRGLINPPSIERSPRVEVAKDLGPIIEIVVRCRQGTAIVSYSKVEQLYCSPRNVCNRSMAITIARACG